MGLPSAVEGTRLVEEALDWNRGGKENGRERRRCLSRVGAEDVEATVEAVLR